MRTSVICSVVSGDSPLRVEWLRNNRPLSVAPASNQQWLPHVQPINQFVSSLLFDRLQAGSAGIYTCRASNGFPPMVAEHSARLIVATHPVLLLKPPTQHLFQPSRQPIRFDCQATGHPQPLIRWKYSPFGSSNYTVAAHSILSSPRIHVLENGSLIIRHSQPSDQGTYVCEASNGVGKSAETIVTMRLLEPIQLSIRFQSRSTNQAVSLYSNSSSTLANGSLLDNDEHSSLDIEKIPEVRVRAGQSVHFDCESVHDSNGVRLEWTRNRIGLLPSFTFNNVNSLQSNWIQSRLKLNDLSQHASGVYTCEAATIHSSNKKSFRLFVQDVPDVPAFLLGSIHLASEHIVLAWEQPFDGHSPLLGYQIQFLHITRLLLSNFQSESMVSTFDLCPATSNYTLAGKSIDSVTGSAVYSSPENSVRNQIQSNLIQSEFVWSSSRTLFASAASTIGNSNKHVHTKLSSLNSRSLYAIRVRAQNQIGFSSYTEPILLCTRMKPPKQAPFALTAQALSTSSIRVQWSWPQSLPVSWTTITAPTVEDTTDVSVEGFQIAYKPTLDGKEIGASGSNRLVIVSVDANQTITPESSITSTTNKHVNHAHQIGSVTRTPLTQQFSQRTFNATIANLVRSTSYSFVIRAFNGEGPGPYSQPVLVATFSMDPPPAPVLRLQSVGHHNFSLSWSLSRSTSNVTIDGFVLRFRPLTIHPIGGTGSADSFILHHQQQQQSSDVGTVQDVGGSVQLPSTERRHVLSNLLCGTRYELSVVAFNQIGESLPSNTIQHTTKGTGRLIALLLSLYMSLSINTFHFTDKQFRFRRPNNSSFEATAVKCHFI